MLAIGIDAEDIIRFAAWKSYSSKSLLRIFNAEEIEYCKANEAKSAERFAARWAAKEACYKALNRFFCEPISYGYFCKQITVTRKHGAELHINWQNIPLHELIRAASVCFSLTHTKSTAIAVVIFS